MRDLQDRDGDFGRGDGDLAAGFGRCSSSAVGLRRGDSHYVVSALGFFHFDGSDAIICSRWRCKVAEAFSEPSSWESSRRKPIHNPIKTAVLLHINF